jgi:hypothetical protein
VKFLFIIFLLAGCSSQVLPEENSTDRYSLNFTTISNTCTENLTEQFGETVFYERKGCIIFESHDNMTLRSAAQCTYAPEKGSVLSIFTDINLVTGNGSQEYMLRSINGIRICSSLYSINKEYF